MSKVKFYREEQIPLEMHKVRVVQKLTLLPVVKPAGGLGAHLNCSEFVPHIPHDQYPAAAVATALYIASAASRRSATGRRPRQEVPRGLRRIAVSN